MIGDGQVSLGSVVVKPNAKKVRVMREKEGAPQIVTGFAGSTADAFTLLERLEAKVEEFEGQGITRPCVELAKAWRTDKYLRRLEAVLLVADKKNMYEVRLERSEGREERSDDRTLHSSKTNNLLLVASLLAIPHPNPFHDSLRSSQLTGNGDVLEASDGIMGVGSGGSYALAAARALATVEDLSAEDIARRSMEIASDMCVYTNKNFVVEVVDCTDEEDEEEEKVRMDEGGGLETGISNI